MFCPACDLDGLPGRFCSECGGALVELVLPCANCGNEDVSGNYCNMCGNPLNEASCPNCKAPNQDGKFCGKCGHSLESEEQAEKFAKPGKTKSGKGTNYQSPATAYCRSHYGNSQKFDSEMKLVTRCTYCGADASFLDLK